MNYCTGSSGFIGSHLSKKLDIIGIPHEKISTTTLKDFDKFFFLSSYGNMAFHTEDEKIIKANITDLVDTILSASKLKFNSFVYLSTSSVKLENQTMYSRTKKAGEEILLSFMEKYHLPIAIIRPFSVTGVGEQKEHLIPTLIRSCYTGEQVNFVQEPVHDFIDVEDVVDGILNLSSNSARGIFELGSGKQYSNAQVLDIVERVTGKKANINFVPSLRPYDNENWVSTNFKSRGWGWSVKKTLEDSVAEMVEAYK